MTYLNQGISERIQFTKSPNTFLRKQTNRHCPVFVEPGRFLSRHQPLTLLTPSNIPVTNARVSALRIDNFVLVDREFSHRLFQDSRHVSLGRLRIEPSNNAEPFHVVCADGKRI